MVKVIGLASQRGRRIERLSQLYPTIFAAYQAVWFTTGLIDQDVCFSVMVVYFADYNSTVSSPLCRKWNGQFEALGLFPSIANRSFLLVGMSASATQECFLSELAAVNRAVQKVACRFVMQVTEIDLSAQRRGI